MNFDIFMALTELLDCTVCCIVGIKMCKINSVAPVRLQANGAQCNIYKNDVAAKTGNVVNLMKHLVRVQLQEEQTTTIYLLSFKWQYITLMIQSLQQ